MKLKSSPKVKPTKTKKTISVKKSTPESIVKKWGVTIDHNWILGPVEFTFGDPRSYASGNPGDLNPLDMGDWWFDGNYNPTNLFSSKESAQLFANGARIARKEIFDSLIGLNGSNDIHNYDEYLADQDKEG